MKNKSLIVIVPIYYQQSRKKTILVGLNWYRNAHYMVLNNVKKHYYSLMLSVKGRIESPIHVHYDIYLKRRGTDGGNVRSVIEKFVLDGLKKSGVIEDDNAEIIVSDSANYYFDKVNPRAEITLRTLNS